MRSGLNVSITLFKSLQKGTVLTSYFSNCKSNSTTFKISLSSSTTHIFFTVCVFCPCSENEDKKNCLIDYSLFNFVTHFKSDSYTDEMCNFLPKIVEFLDLLSR